jgi:branched-chain amino acid transport system ATP-binding protein
MLEVENINTFYGEFQALFDVSMTVEAGQIAGIVGQNGAGKSTIFKSIMGVTPPRDGTITYKGEDITGITPEQAYEKGISMVHADRGIFSDLTVEENLSLGLRSSQYRSDVDLYQYFPQLEEYANRSAAKISGGEQQMLAIARALNFDSDLVMIDEMAEGIMPSVIEKSKEVIAEQNEEGRSFLLIEHDIPLIVDFCDRIYIVDRGSISYSGSTDELEEDDSVLEEHLLI